MTVVDTSATISGMARTPIQTAVARFGGFAEIPVDCGPPHGVITWRFAPGIGSRMLAAIDQMQAATSVVEQFATLSDYLTAVVYEPQRDLFMSLVQSDVIDAETLGLIFQALREDASGMDPTQPPSSEPGSLTDGASSTDGAALAV